jgi:Ca2+-binding RTX toxin-like protein
LPAIEKLELRVLLSTVSFTPHADTAIGDSPIALTTADLNGDGIPDLIVVKKADSDVSVLIGNGDGTFKINHNYSVGEYPDSVVVGDFTGDGHLDIATADQGVDHVSILLNNGDGTFQLNRTDFNVGQYPNALAVGDFNGDGKLDIVTANTQSNTISILFGNGNGTFQPAINLPAGNAPVSVAVGDVSGNGDADIVVSDVRTHSVMLFRGRGNGTFKRPLTFQVGNDPEMVQLADVNGDGKLDILTANSLDKTISVLLNNGGNTFKPAANFFIGPRTIDSPQAFALADMTGDGKLDLVVADTGLSDVSGYTISVLPGNGDGTFGAPVMFDTGYSPTDVAVADLNGDGSPPDVLATNFNDGSFSVLLNNTPSVFGEPTIQQVGSTINVIGTPGPDTIRLTTVLGTSGTENTLLVSADETAASFALSSVTKINVLGGLGNDSIYIGPGVPSVVAGGGRGGDTIVAANSASDTLIGNQGADSISAAAASGNDKLNGGRGPDTLVGGSGQDTLNGQAGTNETLPGVNVGSELAPAIEGVGFSGGFIGAIEAVDGGTDLLLGGGVDPVIAGSG